MSEFEASVEAHDAALAAVGTTIWVGAEPTFTLSQSESPEWLYESLGGDKLAYALRMADEIRRHHPGCLMLRTVGRQYAGEPCPRWSIGLYQRRDGNTVWKGPPDPLTATPETAGSLDLDGFADQLARACIRAGWHCEPLRVEEDPQRRLLLWRGDAAAMPVERDDPRLRRAPIHSGKIPTDGLQDDLAAEGLLLLAIGDMASQGESGIACIELPAFSDVDEFLAFISATEKAAQAAAVDHLVFQGFPPPVNADIAWTTFTPDPAVIEVNQAPQTDVAHFLRSADELYAVAARLGLSPCRLQYNGNISDSGGGGQFTLGGPSPTRSPFLLNPSLLPRLVRYFNRHPALSYWFATDYIGAASQSPRPDEGTREAFRELALTLDQLQGRSQTPFAETLWASLAPFLSDLSGNVHRSELNIEKLWNPYMPGRGLLGLVEFRAFRMPETPHRAAAIAALLRAIAAMLTITDPVDGLKDWGDELHDRFALPHFLVSDLNEVFADLQSSGVGLAPSLQAALVADPFRTSWTRDLAGCEFALEQALDFWPLVGDVASQESGGSRLVDSSTLRLQISLRARDPGTPDLSQWQLGIGGIRIPLRDQKTASGGLRLIGLRYRDFAPWRGLHPNIPGQSPLIFTLSHPEVAKALELTLHNWQPRGEPYSGLPMSTQEAVARRTERLVVREIAKSELAPLRQAPAQAVTAYTLDYRHCGVDYPE